MAQPLPSTTLAREQSANRRTGLGSTLYGIFVLFFRSSGLLDILRPRISGPAIPIEGPLLPVGPALLILLGVWAMVWVREKFEDDGRT